VAIIQHLFNKFALWPFSKLRSEEINGRNMAFRHWTTLSAGASAGRFDAVLGLIYHQ
jgi:hypothetical protein